MICLKSSMTLLCLIDEAKTEAMEVKSQVQALTAKIKQQNSIIEKTR